MRLPSTTLLRRRQLAGPALLAGLAVAALLVGCSSGARRAAAPATGPSNPSTTPASNAVRPTRPVPSSALIPVRSASRPCGLLAAAPAYRHVIWIWMENHSFDAVIGSSAAPYINGLATRCGLATNYHNISHPSLPNYIAATSGLGLSGLTAFRSDCSPSAACSTSASSIFGQGETWKAYQESMPDNCHRSDSGEYAVRHNPPPYFAGLAGCSSHDVPYEQLATDLAGGDLPAFAFVTPNLSHDMHDGSVAAGDRWLARNLPVVLGSPAYRKATMAVFITWDEGEGGTSNDCASNVTDAGCHVATIVVSPSTPPGTKSGVLFNHYSLLGTAEQLLRLPRLGLAAANPTMAPAFGL
jgi:phospholipase C